MHQLIHNDCMKILPSIEHNSVDMILSDLPYGTTNCDWDKRVNLDALWRQYRRVCKGAIVLFAQTPFDKILGCSNLEELRYEWVWEKTHATGHLNAKKMPMKAHENILVFYKKLPTYNPIKTFDNVRKAAVKRGDVSLVYGNQTFGPLVYNSTERYPRSVIKFPSDKQKSNFHPTQKPVALLEYLIKTYTNEGGVVLDSFMGSGSTGVACVNTARRFIGIEISDYYCGIAAKRIYPTPEQTKVRLND